MVGLEAPIVDVTGWLMMVSLLCTAALFCSSEEFRPAHPISALTFMRAAKMMGNLFFIVKSSFCEQQFFVTSFGYS